MEKHFQQVLNNKGQIKVTSKLRVLGHDTIFAVGDITDLDENKMAWHINAQVQRAVYNINQILLDKTTDKFLKDYKAQTNNPQMAVTLGSKQGVVHLPVIGLITNPLMTRQAKAAHMLVPKYRKALGV